MVSTNKLEIIKSIFKAVTTKNGLVIIEDDYNKYSIENFILLIVREALKKLQIDQNIVQIVDKKEILDKEINEFDLLLANQKIAKFKQDSDKIYVYQEDDYFEKIVESEIKKLQLSGKNVELLKGEFDNIIDIINNTNNYATSIYTQDRKKAYEFINRVNSRNVFFNSTLENAKDTKKCEDIFYKIKNISCEYVF